MRSSTRSAWAPRFPARPGGWVVIAILLVLGYRALEAWALRWQAPQLDTSKLGDGQPSIKPDGAAGESVDGLTDGQRHDLLAAEVGSGLPRWRCARPRSCPAAAGPAGLATIAEASGVSGGGPGRRDHQVLRPAVAEPAPGPTPRVGGAAAAEQRPGGCQAGRLHHG